MRPTLRATVPRDARAPAPGYHRRVSPGAFGSGAALCAALLAACSPSVQPGRAAPVRVSTDTPAADAHRAQYTIRTTGCGGSAPVETPCPARLAGEGIQTMEPVVEGDGGYLEVERSSDGRSLWARRVYDGPGAAAFAFVRSDASSSDRAQVLQFVDGVMLDAADPTMPDNGALCWPGCDERSVVAEAWVIDPRALRAARPASGEVFPLVELGSGGDAASLQWMVFFASCREAAGGCVYFGDRCAIWERLQDPYDDAKYLWSWPAECP